MRWRQLCSAIGLSPDGPDIEVASITADTRRVGPGAVFVAVAGSAADGHDFAGEAASRGAALILGARTDLTELHGLPYVHAERPRQALALAAHALAGDPSRELAVVGVTGTNGKTSTVLLLQAILRAPGLRTAAFGTLGNDLGGAMLPSDLTTPAADTLAGMLAQARDAGCTHAVMEASSHAIDQDRVAGIRFAGAAFTNLTQDHLDYHGSMEAYRAAKLRLFEELPPGAFAVINAEDPAAEHFRRAARHARCIAYGQRAEVRASHIRIAARETVFRLHTPGGEQEVCLRLLGRHAVWNALCAAAAAGGLEVPLPAIAEGLEGLERVPGRFEHVDAGQSFSVIVDYAHTEDALRNVLRAARSLCKKRVLVVFGCGGDRDRGKRPRMGRAAVELADYAIITSDNPRTEDPSRILLDIEQGAQHAGAKKHDDYLVISDRAEAIRAAITLARPGDLVLIAGKGHEDYQILGTTRIHFDDREVARAILEGR